MQGSFQRNFCCHGTSGTVTDGQIRFRSNIRCRIGDLNLVNPVLDNGMRHSLRTNFTVKTMLYDEGKSPAFMTKPGESRAGMGKMGNGAGTIVKMMLSTRLNFDERNSALQYGNSLPNSMPEIFASGRVFRCVEIPEIAGRRPIMATTQDDLILSADLPSQPPVPIPRPEMSLKNFLSEVPRTEPEVRVCVDLVQLLARVAEEETPVAVLSPHCFH